MDDRWRILRASIFAAGGGGAGMAAVGIVMPERGVGAHRGASATHPENTLAALKEAVRLGAQQIEFDVRLTRDGYPVLMHDSAVGRTSNGHGLVKDLTLAEIKSLDAGSWKGSCFAGERVPTLAEALDVIPSNVWLNIEIKEGAGVVAREVVRRKLTHQAVLAVNYPAAEEVRRAAPDVLLCNMEREAGDVARYSATTIERGYAFIQLHRCHGVDWPEEIRGLRRAGVRINYCCTDEPSDLPKLYGQGVDFVLVNDLGLMSEAQRKLDGQ